MSKGMLVDADAYNDSQLRIECARCVIDTIGIFINDCESDVLPVTNTLIHGALMGATMLLKDAELGLCKKPGDM